MSRIRQSIKNIKVGLFFYILYIIIGFWSRKVFLEYLGDEFLGLVGTLTNILGFLNIAELGIGTAIGYKLYKPIFNKDKSEINSIISFLGLWYKRIGIFVLGAGLIVSLFLGKIFDNTGFSTVLIYYCYFTFLSSSLIGYFINYHQLMFKVDQKEYILTSYLQTANLIRQILQAAIAFYFENLYLWVTLELLFSLIYSLLIRYKIKKHYPWLEIKRERKTVLSNLHKDINKKIKQVFVHKFSAFVTYGTDSILIYALVNIQSVTFFNNYNMIISMLQNLIVKMFAGVDASIGNLIAEDNEKLMVKIFWEMMSIRFFIACIFFVNIYIFINPFINIWIGEKYILNNFIIAFLLFNFFINIIRFPIDSFLTAFGLFKDTWAPVVQMIINLITSLICGYFYGIAGIIFGTSISLVFIVIIWKPYYLFNTGFNKSIVRDFWLNFLKLIASFLIVLLTINFIKNTYISISSEKFTSLILPVLKLNLILIILSISVFHIFNKGFRDLFYRVINYIKDYK